jgi:hypothetical protein
MSKDDKKAIGLMIVGAGLSVLLRPILGGLFVILGLAVIFSAHLSQPHSPVSQQNILDWSGHPIRLSRTAKPWMLTGIAIALLSVIVIGVVWKFIPREARSSYKVGFPYSLVQLSRIIPAYTPDPFPPNQPVKLLLAFRDTGTERSEHLYAAAHIPTLNRKRQRTYSAANGNRY